MADFTMPSLGADMKAATLVKWLVSPGDPVRRGDVVAEVETEKGLIDIECFESGVVERLTAEPGTKVPVGAVMAVIGIGAPDAAAGRPPAEPPASTSAPAKADSPPPAMPSAAATPPAPAKPPVPATPVARKAAERLGVDLASISGTGPGGRIDRADVERAAEAMRTIAEAPEPRTADAATPLETPRRQRASPRARARAAALGVDLATVTGTGPEGAIEGPDVERAAAAAPAAPEGAEAPPAGAPAIAQVAPAGAPGPMRRAIAAAMAKSKREIPHYYLETRIDMRRALAWLQAENQRRSIEERLLPAVLLLKGVARALDDVPALNGFWIDDAFRPGRGVHLGFAIALKGGGLVAPAIHDVNELTPSELMAHLRDLIPRARAGRLRSSEMTDATLTVTSLGDLGVDSVFGVIYPPQVALVGFGRVAEQPWAENGMVGARPVVSASLAADHRATDGLVGGRFLDALARHLQEPDQL